MNPENLEPYAKDVFEAPWQELEKLIKQGVVIAPVVVRDELKKMDIAELNEWMDENPGMFKELSTQDTQAMRPIVGSYDIYGKFVNFAGDLQIMGFCKARGLILLTSERPHRGTMSKANPKIPNVCDEFDIEWINVVGFFRAESIVFQNATGLSPN